LGWPYFIIQKSTDREEKETSSYLYLSEGGKRLEAMKILHKFGLFYCAT